jgi:hypothetical protein
VSLQKRQQHSIILCTYLGSLAQAAIMLLKEPRQVHLMYIFATGARVFFAEIASVN